MRPLSLVLLTLALAQAAKLPSAPELATSGRLRKPEVDSTTTGSTAASADEGIVDQEREFQKERGKLSRGPLPMSSSSSGAANFTSFTSFTNFTSCLRYPAGRFTEDMAACKGADEIVGLAPFCRLAYLQLNKICSQPMIGLEKAAMENRQKLDLAIHGYSPEVDLCTDLASAVKDGGCADCPADLLGAVREKCGEVCGSAGKSAAARPVCKHLLFLSRARVVEVPRAGDEPRELTSTTTTTVEGDVREVLEEDAAAGDPSSGVTPESKAVGSSDVKNVESSVDNQLSAASQAQPLTKPALLPKAEVPVPAEDSRQQEALESKGSVHETAVQDVTVAINATAASNVSATTSKPAELSPSKNHTVATSGNSAAVGAASAANETEKAGDSNSALTDDSEKVAGGMGKFGTAASSSTTPIQDDDDDDDDRLEELELDNNQEAKIEEETEVEGDVEEENAVQKEETGQEEVKKEETKEIAEKEPAKEEPLREEKSSQSVDQQLAPGNDLGELPSKFEGHLNPYPGSTDDQSGFLSYFVLMTIICIILYLVFHNKQKILAIVLEGRRKNTNGRGRHRGAQYRKLDNNLEEAMGPHSTDSMRHVIY